jgi:hypothetical protein
LTNFCEEHGIECDLSGLAPEASPPGSHEDFSAGPHDEQPSEEEHHEEPFSHENWHSVPDDSHESWHYSEPQPEPGAD